MALAHGVAVIYDATAINDFRRCAEFYRSRHVLNLVREREEEAPKSGQAWHVAMRRWFDGGDSNAAQEALLEAWGPQPLIAPDGKRPLGLFQQLLTLYAEKWPRERDPFEVVRNEEWCEAQIGCLFSNEVREPFRYGGIVDRLIRMDGKQYVMDTKTTSSHLNDAYFAQYVFSTQLRGYVALELVNGHECEGIFVDAVHVNTCTQQAKPEHLQRWGPHRYTPAQLSEWARDAERTIRDIERRIAEYGVEGRWEQHDQACFKWNRPCPFLERCQLDKVIADGLPGYIIEKWEPWRKRERNTAAASPQTVSGQDCDS